MAELPTTPELHPVTGSDKRLSVERIYQRKTQLEHILLRPDTYVGSVEEATDCLYVYDSEQKAIIKKNITFVPGLYKIFDEILVNAADNKQRDKNMNTIKITIDPENNTISVWNNGCGIPVEMHNTEHKYVPELIFGTLLTSSNYDDNQKKVTGGRNGYGAKLCNIFSTEFTVETAYSRSKKLFKMTWKENMGKAGKTIVKESKSDYTKITFKPDLAKFGMTHLTSDMVALMTRRAYDLAGCTRGVAVFFNGEKLPIKSFRDYIELYLKGIPPSPEDEELPRKVVHEMVNDRWEIAVTASSTGFQQASFVNSIATTKGGTHVAYVTDQVVSKLLESAKRKNKGGIDLKPVHIKSHLWIFINCLIENPAFDSQTKENLTLKAKNFGSTCPLGEKFIKSALSCGVIERVLNWARAKSQSVIAKKQSGSKHTKLRGIPKLDDANDAGSKNSLDCTLIVTEGDSAKTLAVSGLGVVGRDHYGVFPLRGKLLNVRDATHNQLMANEEITNLVKILGLNYSKNYSDSTELKTLRYGRLMIMADQDQDGSHIKGLVINFIHNKWPKLLKHNFVEEFITPIVKVTKGSVSKSFYSLPEFEKWRLQTDNHHLWKVKYYKGLGTSTSKEAKEYFSDMDRHRVPFRYSGQEDDDAITLAFSKKKVDQRKEWLSSWLEDRRQRRADGLNESLLYESQTDSISFSDFVNKELILFSNMDNERSIPSVVDGLKPGQRKVLYTCFKRNDKREIKVAQLAGSVAEHSAYHHGEASLMSTIINLAQNFVGSNNINILQPLGQFGTRLHGGKDAASPRYIFTMLSPVTRLLFPHTDDTQLSYLYEDNLKIEPEWYCPIIPLILANGGEGIGTGYSINIPNFNPRELVDNIRRMLDNDEPRPMQPWYKNFTGKISHVEPLKYMVYGRVAILSETSIEITELPVRSWTQHYKESVLEALLHGTEKIQPFITDYKEYHTDTTVRFVITMTPERFAEAQKIGFYKKFKLESSMSINNLVAFDHNGCLKKYSGPAEILDEFYDVRLDMYERRKEYLEGMLKAEANKLTNQARFILEKIEGKIVVENKKKVQIIEDLKQAGYRSDPVKAWKASLNGNEEEVASDEESGSDNGPDYNYLLSMSMWSLTLEKKEELLKQRDDKVEELRILQEKTHRDLWKEDLAAFLAELDRVEAIEREEQESGSTIVVKRSKKGKPKARQTTLAGPGKNSIAITKPSSFGEFIAPTVPAYNDKPKGAKRAKKEVAKPVTTSAIEKLEGTPAESDDDSKSVESISLAERMAKKGGKEKKQTKLAFNKNKKAELTAVDEIAKDKGAEIEEPMDVEVPEPASPVTRPKRVAKKINLDYSADDIQEFPDSEDDFVIPKKKTLPKSKSSSSVSSSASGKGSSAESGKGKSKKTITKPQPQKLTIPDDSDDEDSMVVPKPTGRSAPRVSDSSDDEETLEAPKAATKKAPTKTQKTVLDLADSNDEETVEPTKRRAAAKNTQYFEDSIDEDICKPQPAKKKPAATKSKKKVGDSDDEDPYEPPKRKPAAKGKDPVIDLDSEDDDDLEPPAKRKPASKAAAKPKATTRTKQPAKKAAEKTAPKRKTQAKSTQKTLLEMDKAVKKGKPAAPSIDDLLEFGAGGSGEEAAPVPKKTAPAKKSAPAKKAAPKPKAGAKRPRAAVNESDKEEVESPPKRAARKKRVTYTLKNLASSDEDEGSEFSITETESDDSQ